MHKGGKDKDGGRVRITNSNKLPITILLTVIAKWLHTHWIQYSVDTAVDKYNTIYTQIIML